ncbi:MAG: DNA repair protein RadC [Deltaproteobacteria bacterium]|nr:DNA repair protein RadC [Deltaproteobacteria bacterium]
MSDDANLERGKKRSADRKSEHKGAGHRKRLREKFLMSGLDGFHDYEVIELLLTLATPRKDCKTPAKDALKRFKTLQGVFEASSRELCEVDGIGPKNLMGIKLVKAVAERYLNKKLVGQDVVSNSRALFQYLDHHMRDKDRECFEVIYLDAKNKVIGTETLFRGTLTASSVYPREVVRAALDHRAAALIFAHNHPSGEPDPSPEDAALTRQLVFACRTLGITVHEHLIVGNGSYFSFADQGFIAQMNQDYDGRS